MERHVIVGETITWKYGLEKILEDRKPHTSAKKRHRKQKAGWAEALERDQRKLMVWPQKCRLAGDGGGEVLHGGSGRCPTKQINHSGEEAQCEEGG